MLYVSEDYSNNHVLVYKWFFTFNENYTQKFFHSCNKYICTGKIIFLEKEESKENSFGKKLSIIFWSRGASPDSILFGTGYFFQNGRMLIYIHSEDSDPDLHPQFLTIYVALEIFSIFIDRKYHKVRPCMLDQLQH